MSDVSKTNEELAAEAFPLDGSEPATVFEARRRMVAVLAATRVPVQGEPNGDREVLKRIAEEASVQRLKDSIEEWRKAIGAAYGTFPDDWELEFWHAGYKHGANAMIEHQVSRAAVPDAATEVAYADLVAERDDLEERLAGYLCDSTGGLLSKTGYDVRTMVAHAEEYYDRVHAEARKEAEAERDAATAAIERVRAEATALRAVTSSGNIRTPPWVMDAVDRLFAALDGAPEPERDVQELEYLLSEHSFDRYDADSDMSICACGWGEPEFEDHLAKVVRGSGFSREPLPMLTEEQVLKLAHAEADHGNDNGNEGAYLEALTYSLREAGIPFAEQPFIAGGWLTPLPVEGESDA